MLKGILGGILAAPVVALFYLVMLPLVLLEGWVLTKLWAWFVVPVFGLPSLGILAAAGIALVAGLLTHQDADCESPKRDREEKVARMVVLLYKPLAWLFFGWVIKEMM